MKKYNLARVVTFVALALFLVLALVACGECEHEWGEWQTTGEPVCGADGMRERVCAKCDKTEVEAVAALSHEFSDYVPNGDATCVSAGSESTTCKNCGVTHTRASSVDASKHVSDAFVMEVDAKDDAYHVKKHACCGAVASRGEHALYRYSLALAEGVVSCESGVIKTMKCALCDVLMTDTVYEHVGLENADFMVSDAPVYYVMLGEYLANAGILYEEEPCIRITSDCLCGAKIAGIELMQGEPIRGDRLFDRHLIPFSAFDVPDGTEPLRHEVVTAFYTDNLPPDEGGEIHIEYRILFEQLLREVEGRLVYEVRVAIGYDESTDTADAQFVYQLKELATQTTVGE